MDRAADLLLCDGGTHVSACKVGAHPGIVGLRAIARVPVVSVMQSPVAARLLCD